MNVDCWANKDIHSSTTFKVDINMKSQNVFDGQGGEGVGVGVMVTYTINLTSIARCCLSYMYIVSKALDMLSASSSPYEISISFTSDRPNVMPPTSTRHRRRHGKFCSINTERSMICCYKSAYSKSGNGQHNYGISTFDVARK